MIEVYIELRDENGKKFNSTKRGSHKEHSALLHEGRETTTMLTWRDRRRGVERLAAERVWPERFASQGGCL